MIYVEETMCVRCNATEGQRRPNGWRLCGDCYEEHKREEYREERTMINKFCDVWMIEPYDWHEPMLAETEEEAKKYAKKFIIDNYELSPEVEISEKYFKHRQMYNFWVEGLENDRNLISIQPISWAQ